MNLSHLPSFPNAMSLRFIKQIVLGAAIITLLATFTVLAGFDPSPNLIASQYQSDPASPPPASKSKTEPERPTIHLQPEEQYLGFLPYGGLSNQYYTLQNAAYFALRLNRTLLLPPIMRSRHETGASYQRWAEFFDLQRLTAHTGLKVLEWLDGKAMTPDQVEVGFKKLSGDKESYSEWEALAENITIQIIQGHGRTDLRGVALEFLDMFLLSPTCKEPPPPPPQPPVFPDSIGDTVSRIIGGTWKDLSQPSTSTVAKDISDILRRYEGSKDQVIHFSHTFSVQGSPEFNPWETIGRHIHFTRPVMDFAIKLVEVTIKGGDVAMVGIDAMDVGNGTSTSNKTDVDYQQQEEQSRKRLEQLRYIGVHLRRSDIGNKCQNKANRKPEDCTPSIERYAAAVALAKDEFKKMRPGQESGNDNADIPVIVATDTTSEKDFEDIRQLGWYLIDHDKAQTKMVLGMFGSAIADAAILANAEVFVGNRMSSMSWLAQARQTTWHEHKTFYP